MVKVVLRQFLTTKVISIDPADRSSLLQRSTTSEEPPGCCMQVCYNMQHKLSYELISDTECCEACD